MKKLALGTLAVSLLASCASSYKVIGPNSLNYRTTNEDRNIEFSYKYDVLNERGNRKYAKKESRTGVKVVAVRVTNNSQESFVFGQDLRVHSNGIPINIIEPKVIQQQLKQGVPIYLLYLLLTPLQLNTGDSSTPIGLAVGPGITVGNMVAAASANSKLLQELENNFLNGQKVDPGETVHGLIGIRDSGYNPLTLE